MTLRNQNTPATTYEVSGGTTSVAGGPTPSPYFFLYSNGGALTFESSSNTVFVRDSTIDVEGGRGHDAPGGMVTIRNAAGIYGATTIHTTGGPTWTYTPRISRAWTRPAKAGKSALKIPPMRAPRRLSMMA